MYLKVSLLEGDLVEIECSDWGLKEIGNSPGQAFEKIWSAILVKSDDLKRGRVKGLREQADRMESEMGVVDAIIL